MELDFTNLWVDKYRPKEFSDLNYNTDLTKSLKKLSDCDNLPHLIFYGPSGAGKKTRVMCLLRAIYGPGVLKVNKETFTHKKKSKLIEVPILSSRYHIDLTPSDAQRDDKLILQTLIKETASTKQLNSLEQSSFKMIVLNEAENLTHEAQASLRRTMETYVKTCRLILICENVGNIIPALQSRCLLVRVSAPMESDILKVLKGVNESEEAGFDDEELEDISSRTRNLRRALIMLQNEAVRKVGGLNKSERVVDWEDATRKMASDVMKEQSAKMLKSLRCYDLLVNCIPGGMILSSLLKHLLPKFDSSFKGRLIRLAAKYDTMMRKGNKEVVFIEAFLANVMVLARRQLNGEKGRMEIEVG